MLTLYIAPGASSMAPHIALNEIGCPFELKALSFHANETRQGEFLTVNPEGKVPTLVTEDGVLTEVAGVLYYLARLFPEARLLPTGDAWAEARVVSWMSFIASAIHPARRQGLDAAMAVYKIADGRLEDGAWAVGDYSIADIHLFRLYWRFKASLKPPPGAFPGLDAHHDRMLARPAVIKTIETESAIGYELPA
ncbi:MAG TPA: glutathione S-transferase N-terminal domain-containing protein [Caulobacteraceae bacterium]|jgi:glutathione S-transferase